MTHLACITCCAGVARTSQPITKLPRRSAWLARQAHEPLRRSVTATAAQLCLGARWRESGVQDRRRFCSRWHLLLTRPLLASRRLRPRAVSAAPSGTGGEMFERFTDRARRVVVLAQEEARMLNHNYIGTEDILLGLIHEGEGVAAKALESLGISLESVRQQVEEIIGQG